MKNKMKNKRDRLEVIFDILKIIKNNSNNIKVTPLLRYSNLSFNNFNLYYNDLLLKKFIKEEIDKKGKKYVTLDKKGQEFLQEYKVIKQFLKNFELE